MEANVPKAVPSSMSTISLKMQGVRIEIHEKTGAEVIRNTLLTLHSYVRRPIYLETVLLYIPEYKNEPEGIEVLVPWTECDGEGSRNANSHFQKATVPFPFHALIDRTDHVPEICAGSAIGKAGKELVPSQAGADEEQHGALDHGAARNGWSLFTHGNISVNPHGIGRWHDAVQDGIDKGTGPVFIPSFRHELETDDRGCLTTMIFYQFQEIPLFLIGDRDQKKFIKDHKRGF